MNLFKRQAPSCEAPRCTRGATSLLSWGDHSAYSCAAHIGRWEKLWGQVWVRGIPARCPRWSW